MLTFPGINDRASETSALLDFVEKYKVDLIQMRNLNIDAELLYKKKLEKAEKYYYPKNIKKYIEILYKDMNNEYLKCERSFQCIMDTFIEYSTMFEYL